MLVPVANALLPIIHTIAHCHIVVLVLLGILIIKRDVFRKRRAKK